MAHVEAFRGHLKSYFAGLIILRQGWQVVIATSRVNSTRVPRVAYSCAQPEPVQRACDLLVTKLPSHLSNDLDRLGIRAPPAPTGLTFLHAHFRMTPAGPVNQQNTFSAFFLHLGNDLADQNPHDPLLQSHVRSRRVPNRRQILRQTQQNLRIRHRCRFTRVVKLVQFVFQQGKSMGISSPRAKLGRARS
ncbi:MAG: hypothetical protein DMG70_29920 [Acidobacteria bacterium]|nr:MAG: hypothetical protein DMG70_29920 [Acidobacteriota bacterium]